MRPVFVIAVLGVTACVFTFGGLATNGAVNVLAVLVAVLLGHDEADAKKHLARRLVCKNKVVGKLEVFDNASVEEVDDFSRFFHVAGETVGRPNDNAVVFPIDDAVQHFPELWSFVRELGRLFLVDTVNHLHAQAVCKLPTGVELVGDTPFLLFATVRALAGVYDVAKTGQVEFGGSVVSANSKALLESSNEACGLQGIVLGIHTETFCAKSGALATK